jgi:hypothetical protein
MQLAATFGTPTGSQSAASKSRSRSAVSSRILSAGWIPGVGGLEDRVPAGSCPGGKRRLRGFKAELLGWDRHAVLVDQPD